VKAWCAATYFFCFLVVLEQRRVHHPEQVPARRVLGVARAVLGDEAQLLAQVQAEVRQHGVDLASFPNWKRITSPGFAP